MNEASNNLLKKAREIVLRVMRFEEVQYVPCYVFWPPATWYKYREKLMELMRKYPSLFSEEHMQRLNFDNYPFWRKNTKIVDEWGCVWKYEYEGLEGQVVISPLQNIASLKNYTPPDPLKQPGPRIDSRPPLETWAEVAERIKRERKQGILTFGYLPHGCMFQRLYYLRGFNNFMKDLVTEASHLKDIINMVLEYNLALINKWLEMEVDVIVFGDDMGAQDRLLINPKLFRKHILPAFREMFKICHEGGAYVYLHSDGHIIEIVEDLIRAGVNVLNLQDKVNGIENIEKTCKGKVCIDLDIDRQFLLPSGSPDEIKRYVEAVVRRLGSKNGGLMLKADIYPDVPVENIDAICDSFSRLQPFPLRRF